jgi:tRNA nucleotidyltransferase (CCA-adding enzyme)
MKAPPPDHITKLASAVEAAGGRAYLVGGAVRDRLLNIECKDFDLEVYGLEVDSLESLLLEFGTVHLIGKQFAVLLH